MRVYGKPNAHNVHCFHAYNTTTPYCKQDLSVYLSQWGDRSFLPREA